MKLLTILSGVMSLAATVLAYSNPLPCSGVCGNAHDPALIRRTSDGTYFRFSTGGGIAVHTASSAQGPWVYKGQVLPNGANVSNAGKTDLWAPDVSLVGNTYYLYYTASQFGTQNSVIGLATSTSLDVGTWSDKGSSKLLVPILDRKIINGLQLAFLPTAASPTMPSTPTLSRSDHSIS